MIKLDSKPTISTLPTDAIIDQLEERVNEHYAIKFAALASGRDAELAWLRQSRSKPVEPIPLLGAVDGQLLTGKRDDLAVDDPVPTPAQRPTNEPLILDPSLKLSDAVRAIVQSAWTDGIKTNDVIVSLEKVKHPISECSDFRKRVSTALCALRSNGRPEALHPRSNKFRLYKDEETGRFFDPEAWNLRQA